MSRSVSSKAITRYLPASRAKDCRGYESVLPGAAAAELRRQLQGCGLDDLTQRRQVVVVELTHCTRHADGRDNFTTRGKHWRGNTTHTDGVFLIVKRIPLPPDWPALRTGAAVS